MKKTKVGIMGGTFNPIHNGHLNASAEIAHMLDLHKIVLIPSYTPPHKADNASMIRHRKNMTAMSVIDDPLLEVSTLEIERKGISYTIDTIREIKKQFPENTEFFFILGTDAFLEIGDWKDAPRLFSQCNFVVARRSATDLSELISTLDKTVTQKFGGPQFVTKTANKHFPRQTIRVSNSAYSIFVVPTSFLEISSTDIRKRIKQKKSFRYLVPDRVHWYIKKEKLYL